MTIRPMLAAAILSGLTMFATAQAATITLTGSVSLSDVELSGALSAPQFDPTLGTLTGVTWSITGAIASIIGISNDSAGPITGSAFTSVDFNVASTVLSLGASPDFNVFASTGTVALGVGESVLFPVTAFTTITGSEMVSAAFIGSSVFEVLYLTITSFGGSGFGGDVSISQATDAGIDFSITYEFETVAPEIPLPAAAPLMAAGLGALGLFGVRRRKRA